MKFCPVCQRAYRDDALNYCLEDGASLSFVEGAAPETQVIPLVPTSPGSEAKPTVFTPPASFDQQVAPTQYVPPASYSQPAPRARSPLPWILAAAVVLGLSGVVIALLVTRNRDTNQAKLNGPETAPTPSASTAPADPPSITFNTVPTPAPLPASIPSSSPAAQQAAPGKPAEQPTPASKPTPAPKPTSSQETPKQENAKQESAKPADSGRVVSGGVMNGKAISLPKSAYPAAAKAVNASGTVNVQVMIDELGKVISAKAVSGHPLLQSSAVQAAYGARFSPTTLGGQPVKVSGIITYNFLPQ